VCVCVCVCVCACARARVCVYTVRSGRLLTNGMKRNDVIEQKRRLQNYTTARAAGRGAGKKCWNTLISRTMVPPWPTDLRYVYFMDLYHAIAKWYPNNVS